ncbi:hypothetical protein ACFX13_040686 [Malus domestica]
MQAKTPLLRVILFVSHGEGDPLRCNICYEPSPLYLNTIKIPVVESSNTIEQPLVNRHHNAFYVGRPDSGRKQR